MTRAQQSVLGLFLLAAASSVWLHLRALDETPVSAAGQVPLVSVDQPRWTLFNPQGEPEKQLEAERMEQWSKQEPALLLKPHLRLVDQQQHHWIASAERGWVFAGDKPIQLENNVVLQRAEADAMSLTTSELRISRNGNRVETGAAVVLSAGNWHFNAVGMNADLGRQRVELLNRVQGHHE